MEHKRNSSGGNFKQQVLYRNNTVDFKERQYLDVIQQRCLSIYLLRLLLLS